MITNVLYTVWIPLTNQPINSMAQSLSWEANSPSAGQEIPRLLRYPKLHYCVQDSPPLAPGFANVSTKCRSSHTTFAHKWWCSSDGPIFKTVTRTNTIHRPQSRTACFSFRVVIRLHFRRNKRLLAASSFKS